MHDTCADGALTGLALVAYTDTSQASVSQYIYICHAQSAVGELSKYLLHSQNGQDLHTYLHKHVHTYIFTGSRS